MKPVALLLTLLLVALIGQAQETDTLQTETIPETGFWPNVTSLYFGVGTEAAPTPAGIEPSLQWQLGGSYKKWHIGFVFTDYLGVYEQRLIFPNQFSMLYRHGGVFLGREIWRSNFFRIHGLIQWSHGDVVWQRNSTGEDVFRDKMTIWQPGLQLEINPEFLASGYVNVGYRQVSTLELPDLSSEDFSGLVVQFGVRIGLFRKSKKDIAEDEEDQ